MRIGFFAYESVNARYRAYIPGRALHAAGHEVLYEASTTVPARLAAFSECDVVHIYRHCGPDAQRLARWLRSKGVAVVWDNDDQLSGVPRDHPQYRRLGGFRGVEADAHIRSMLRLADVVTTPSAVLADRYREAGVRTAVVIENYLPDEFLVDRRGDRDRVTICWMGAIEHRVDAQRLDMGPRLRRLIEAHDVDLLAIGVGLDIADSRYRYVKTVDFAQLTHHLADGDIGIAPLVAEPFNDARSNVKLKEYAAAGLAWLASPRAPYAGLDEAQGGRLIEDGDWEAAIGRLIEKARERRKLAKRAARWAREQTITRNVGEWERASALATNVAGART